MTTGWKIRALRNGGGALAFALLSCAAGTVRAGAADVAEGEQLYVSQCKLCHGSARAEAARLPGVEGRERLLLAMNGAAAVNDAGAGFAAGTGSRLVFAPPFGPNLQGVFGRLAGTVPGYDYSKALKASLSGLEWNAAALDVWITNPQKWVPGVYMFYKQPDPEIRRKIIAYLEASR